MGVAFALAGTGRAVDWCGLGPGPAYPDTGQAARIGWHRTTVDGLQERTVRPQEAGARGGIRWARLGAADAGEPALELEPRSGADPAHSPALTVRPWSVETLEAASHDDELVDDGRTHVIVDLARSGVGTARCGPGVLAAYRLPAQSVRGSIRFSLSDLLFRPSGGIVSDTAPGIEIDTGVDGIVVRLRADRAARRSARSSTATWRPRGSATGSASFRASTAKTRVWGPADELKYADGATVAEAFSRRARRVHGARAAAERAARQPGLHGAVWFETVYQDPADPSGRTLYALYHNENYPETLPYDADVGRRAERRRLASRAARRGLGARPFRASASCARPTAASRGWTAASCSRTATSG